MEIRNITQIHSNQSFGMALKVDPDDVRYLLNYTSANCKDSYIIPGLKQIIREQKNNKHFDIVYQPNKDRFAIVPKTEVAKKMSYRKYQECDDIYPNNVERYRFDFEDKEKLTFIQKTRLHTGVFLRKLTNRLFNKREFLPGGLRQVSDYTTDLEKEANQIKKVRKIFEG